MFKIVTIVSQCVLSSSASLWSLNKDCSAHWWHIVHGWLRRERGVQNNDHLTVHFSQIWCNVHCGHYSGTKVHIMPNLAESAACMAFCYYHGVRQYFICRHGPGKNGVPVKCVQMICSEIVHIVPYNTMCLMPILAQLIKIEQPLHFEPKLA